MPSFGSGLVMTRWRWWKDYEICLTTWERCHDGGSFQANCSCCPCDEPHEGVWGERAGWGRTECVIIVNTSWESQTLRQGHSPQSHYGLHEIRNRNLFMFILLAEESSKHNTDDDDDGEYSTNLSKEDWYSGVGELLGLCLQGLWGKLPVKQGSICTVKNDCYRWKCCLVNTRQRNFTTGSSFSSLPSPWFWLRTCTWLWFRVRWVSSSVSTPVTEVWKWPSLSCRWGNRWKMCLIPVVTEMLTSLVRN